MSFYVRPVDLCKQDRTHYTEPLSAAVLSRLATLSPQFFFFCLSWFAAFIDSSLVPSLPIFYQECASPDLVHQTVLMRGWDGSGMILLSDCVLYCFPPAGSIKTDVQDMTP